MVRTLVDAGSRVCFSNPGTSEMHFVAAFDAVPEMRGVLCLFEGVASGAADGYARISGRPATTLLHLGPGLGNGLANLHNARRAHSPVVVVVGDHATYHKRHDAQLESDIESVARNVSGWLRRGTRAEDAGADAADAVAAALSPPGQVATVILPADVSWSDGGAVAAPRPVRKAAPPPPDVVEDVARRLRGPGRAALLLGGHALRAPALRAAARVAAITGARLLSETFPARLERGAGLPAVERIAYLAEMATAQLDGLGQIVLVGARAPVTFFAYPGRVSWLTPAGCDITTLAGDGDDPTLALEALADALGAPAGGAGVAAPGRPPRPTGALTAATVGQAIGAVLPEGAIVSDEANTAGFLLGAPTAGAPPHDWLTLTGGAIGQGLPVAVGAAVAAPGRPVLALEADGSAMYTLQSLWTMAREQLDVTVVLFNNRAYSILALELGRVGAGGGGPRARAMLELTPPDLDFVALARGLGVPASRVTTAEDLTRLLDRHLGEPGPALLEVVVPPIF